MSKHRLVLGGQRVSQIFPSEDHSDFKIFKQKYKIRNYFVHSLNFQTHTIVS